MRKRLLPLAGSAALCYASMASGAAWVNVGGLSIGELYLVVGAVGAPTAPGPTNVTMTVPTAQMGDPLIPIVGTPNVQIQMGIRRRFGPQITATLTAIAPGALTSGANQIPIDQISWTSVGLTPAWRCDQTIAGGAFVTAGGPQVIDTLLISVNDTYWSCGELTFSFANAQTYPAGTYTGTVTFTASRT